MNFRTKENGNQLRRHRALSILAGGLLALGTAMIASAGDPVIVIKMVDMPASYQPAEARVRIGDTVEWKNVGNSVHNASSDASMAAKPGEASTPPGAAAFDSGFMKPGETYTHTFTVPGVYKYVCAPHETSGMTGTIIVEPREQAAR